MFSFIDEIKKICYIVSIVFLFFKLVMFEFALIWANEQRLFDRCVWWCTVQHWLNKEKKCANTQAYMMCVLVWLALLRHHLHNCFVSFGIYVSFWRERESILFLRLYFMHVSARFNEFTLRFSVRFASFNTHTQTNTAAFADGLCVCVYFTFRARIHNFLYGFFSRAFFYWYVVDDVTSTMCCDGTYDANHTDYKRYNAKRWIIKIYVHIFGQCFFLLLLLSVSPVFWRLLALWILDSCSISTVFFSYTDTKENSYNFLVVTTTSTNSMEIFCVNSILHHRYRSIFFHFFSWTFFCCSCWFDSSIYLFNLFHLCKTI